MSMKFKKIIRYIPKIIYILLLSIFLMIVGLVFASSNTGPFNIRTLSVQSSSMEPSIHKGSLIIVTHSDTYNVGDVITVSEPSNPKVNLTHRITRIELQDDKTYYVTKGDANETEDLEERPAEYVEGKTIFSIPLLGYVFSFAKTREGLLFLIIIPGTIFIYNELLNIKNETKRLLIERKKRKLSKKEDLIIEIGEEEIQIESFISKIFRRFKKLANNEI